MASRKYAGSSSKNESELTEGEDHDTMNTVRWMMTCRRSSSDNRTDLGSKFIDELQQSAKLASSEITKLLDHFVSNPLSQTSFCIKRSKLI